MAGTGGMSFNPPPGPASDWLSNFIHWAWYGKQNGAGLGAVPGQFASSVDPRSRAGLLNLASMFVPGGGKFDASEQLGELGMPGQFEQYSPTKASLGHQLGMQLEGQGHQLNYAIRAANKGVPAGRYGDWAQFVHDTIFGGEAHTKGPIPSAKSPREFTRREEQQQALNDHERLQELLGKSQEHRLRAENARDPHGHEFDAAAEQIAAERQSREEAKQRAIAQMLHQHGMANHDPRGQPEFVAHIERTIKSDRMPDQARGYAGKRIKSGISPKENLIGGGTRAERQAALRRILAQQQFNHRN